MPRREDYLGAVGTLFEGGRRQRGVGFTLRAGGLVKLARSDMEAATNLIAAFALHLTPPGLDCGTVVCFRGNTTGTKAAGCVPVGADELGTAPGTLLTRLTDDQRGSLRIDRQKYIKDAHGREFCDYHIQIAARSVACVLVRVNFDVGGRAIRHAFHLSLEEVKNVWVDPSDGRSGYFRVES